MAGGLLPPPRATLLKPPCVGASLLCLLFSPSLPSRTISAPSSSSVTYCHHSLPYIKSLSCSQSNRVQPPWLCLLSFSLLHSKAISAPFLSLCHNSQSIITITDNNNHHRTSNQFTSSQQSIDQASKHPCASITPQGVQVSCTHRPQSSISPASRS
jgi:hypothetical protein